MANPLISSLEQLLAPVSLEQFFAEIHGRKPLHISGDPAKFASVMSWQALNRMLEMNVWNSYSLQLMMDRQRVPPGAYCRNTVDRNQQRQMQPDSEKVTGFVAQGASLLLNEIESLHPGVMAVVEALESTIGGKSSANLYCSWQQRQAFDSHCDKHDVYALQIIGEKRWNIYQGRDDNPIEHPAFKNVPQAENDRKKGAVAQQLTLSPGDLLYLPRGQYHDALASSQASVHVTFSCSEPKGLDWLTTLWEQAVADSLFRADLPRAEGPDGEAALRAHLEALCDHLREIALSPQGVEQAKAIRRHYGIKRDRYDLPNVSSQEDAGIGLPLRQAGRGRR